MGTIYILTVENKNDDIISWYFSTLNKASEFIKNNFSFDLPRKITPDYWEGTECTYAIDDYQIDQDKF